MGNFSGVAAAWITGAIVNYTHSFLLAFGVSCVILLIGVYGYWFVIGDRTRVRWSTEPVELGDAELDARAAEV
jgi:MFS-type transporter involved in bile tolerance (Atg22 family)